MVTAYEYLEKVKSKVKGDIVKDYNEVMEWMLFLYNYPQAQDEIQANNNDIIKPVHTANTYVNKIAGLIESHAAELDINKSNIEKRLLDETRAFQTELEDVHRQVDKFKELHNRR